MSTSLPNKAHTGFLADLLSPRFKFLCLRMSLKNNIKEDIIKILLIFCTIVGKQRNISLGAEFGILTLSNTVI